MSAPDRPAREWVDADLATVEGWSGLRRYPDAMVATEAAIGLAAEVRALRAELDQQGHELTVRRLQDLVAARTPQPADPADTAKVGDHLGKAWVDAQQTLHQGGCRTVAPGGVWMCTRSGHPNGSQHVSTAGGRVVVAWGPAPLPAVPDGEDVPARLDAAADALAEERPYLAGLLRHAGAWFDTHPITPETRAAVAAALARPTGDVR